MKKRKWLAALCAAMMLVSLFMLAACGDPEHEHAWGEWTTVKEATCLEDGSKERVCGCGEKQTETIKALGHKWGNPYLDNGVYKHRCGRCGAVENSSSGGSSTESTVVSTGAALAEAIKKGGTIEIAAWSDIEITSAEWDSAMTAARGKEITVLLADDLTITGGVDYLPAATISANTKLTIKHKDTYSGCGVVAVGAGGIFYVNEGAGLTLEGVSLRWDGIAVQVVGDNAKVTLDGCEAESGDVAQNEIVNVGADNVDVTVTGCDFERFDDSIPQGYYQSGIYFNSKGGALTVSDTVIYAFGRGIVVAEGTAVLTAVTARAWMGDIEGDDTTWTQNAVSGSWSAGEIPLGALVASYFSSASAVKTIDITVDGGYYWSWFVPGQVNNLTGCLNAWYISNPDADSSVTVTAKGNITFGPTSPTDYGTNSASVVNVGGKAKVTVPDKTIYTTWDNDQLRWITAE